MSSINNFISEFPVSEPSLNMHNCKSYLKINPSYNPALDILLYYNNRVDQLLSVRSPQGISAESISLGCAISKIIFRSVSR